MCCGFRWKAIISRSSQFRLPVRESIRNTGFPRMSLRNSTVISWSNRDCRRVSGGDGVTARRMDGLTADASYLSLPLRCRVRYSFRTSCSRTRPNPPQTSQDSPSTSAATPRSIRLLSPGHCGVVPRCIRCADRPPADGWPVIARGESALILAPTEPARR